MAMAERTRDESSTSSVCVCLHCVVCTSSAACGNTGVRGYKTRVHVYPVPTTGNKRVTNAGTPGNMFPFAQEGPKPKKRRTAADVRQEQFAARLAALLHSNRSHC